MGREDHPTQGGPPGLREASQVPGRVLGQYVLNTERRLRADRMGGEWEDLNGPRSPGILGPCERAYPGRVHNRPPLQRETVREPCSHEDPVQLREWTKDRGPGVADWRVHQRLPELKCLRSLGPGGCVSLAMPSIKESGRGRSARPRVNDDHSRPERTP